MSATSLPVVWVYDITFQTDINDETFTLRNIHVLESHGDHETAIKEARELLAINGLPADLEYIKHTRKQGEVIKLG